MINRLLITELQQTLKHFPAVAILGARQTGKTTLAKLLAKGQKKQTIYLDLESPFDRNRLLEDTYSFLDENSRKLVILDEVQRMPELFAMLRSLIDKHRKPGRFLLLGSASPHLVKGVSESLAGRIFNAELGTINLSECADAYTMKKHWFRGGFPQMLTAKSDLLYTQRMDTFITTFVERDLRDLFDIAFTPDVMRNFWQMLAHSNGGIWNANEYSRSLGITAPTVNRYLNLLAGSYMVHRLPAFHYRARKRIVKAAKVYLRDTGVMHRLMRLNHFDELRRQLNIGASWESYVVEQIYQLRHHNVEMYYYRTQNGAEADVVLTKAGLPLATIEIKLNNSPTLARGYFECIDDLKTTKNFVVVPEGLSYNKASNIKVCGLTEFLNTHLPTLK